MAVWHPKQRSFSGAHNPTYLASVYGIGLGYGILDDDAGVRIDGMNLYHNTVGAMLLDGLRPFDGLVSEQLKNALGTTLLWRHAAAGSKAPSRRCATYTPRSATASTARRRVRP